MSTSQWIICRCMSIGTMLTYDDSVMSHGMATCFDLGKIAGLVMVLIMSGRPILLFYMNVIFCPFICIILCIIMFSFHDCVIVTIPHRVMSYPLRVAQDAQLAYLINLYFVVAKEFTFVTFFISALSHIEHVAACCSWF